MRLHTEPPIAQESPRAEANRRNAQRSTGPRTAEGKTRSSQNAFKHGLYSNQLITASEDPTEFDQLRATLRSEHQPANTTEEILVDELAQNFWRMRRFRKMEAQAWAADDFAPFIRSGFLELITRTLASTERSFHRTLTALTKLQKARGFVPQKTQPVSAAAPHGTEFIEDDRTFAQPCTVQVPQQPARLSNSREFALSKSIFTTKKTA